MDPELLKQFLGTADGRFRQSEPEQFDNITPNFVNDAYVQQRNKLRKRGSAAVKSLELSVCNTNGPLAIVPSRFILSKLIHAHYLDTHDKICWSSVCCIFVDSKY
ncbi:hypothetical protein GJ496_007062 [Pomphorhynchus laevis]|nr:hypothetical protein GJ496_007062 [Pomphorhynchus laevis]